MDISERYWARLTVLINTVSAGQFNGADRTEPESLRPSWVLNPFAPETFQKDRSPASLYVSYYKR